MTIDAVEAGSGAATAGLRAGDVIIAVDGRAITDYDGLARQFSGKQPGTRVTLTIERNGAEQQIAVMLQARAA